jgi:uncharacterized membrane protein YfcA
MTSTTEEIPKQRSLVAFLYAIPIAILGGLIGLGGAEFRLPVLVRILRYSAHQAVPLNLAVSLVTVIASFIVRSRTLSLAPLSPYTSAIGSMIGGAVITAFIGPALAGRLSREQLERMIVLLLVGIGVALIVEGFLPQTTAALLPANLSIQILAGILFGLAIGLVSSLLGVAGGELIIPTLVFAYGADIKVAGTASLIISLPTIMVGLIRYATRKGFTDRRPLTHTVAPMGIGSIIGAIIGGLLVGAAPTWILKIGLGCVLTVSAVRAFRHSRTR